MATIGENGSATPSGAGYPNVVGANLLTYGGEGQTDATDLVGHAAEHTAMGMDAEIGSVFWLAGDKAQTLISGGANTPVVTATAPGELQVVTPTTDWCELTLTTPRASRLLPLNLVLECESPDWSKVSTIAYYIGTSGYADFWTRTWNSQTSGVSAGPELMGSGSRKLFTEQTIMQIGGGAPVFNSTMVDTHKLRITPVSGQSATVVLKSLRYDTDDSTPSISITFDDGYRTVVENALPLLTARGLKATMFVISDAIGATGRNCTMAQLRQWRAAGMECSPHGPLGLGSVSNLAAYANTDLAVADMKANRKFLVDNGLVSRGEENFYAWPQGIRSMGGDLRDTSLIEAAAEAGFFAARGVLYNHCFHPDIISGYPQRYEVPVIGHSKDYGGNEATNITNLLAKIDELVDKKISGCFIFHDVGAVPTNTIDITTANFTTLMNRIALRVSQGVLRNDFIFDQVNYRP